MATRRSVSMCRMVVARIATCAFICVGHASSSSAQERVTEEPDVTRLDVERLPPEAIRVTRDLYAHGFFIDARIGGRAFTGALGKLSSLGVYGSLGAGYEIFPWLQAKVAAELSIHSTDAPPPPATAAFGVLGAIAELRAQANLSARVALWIAGEGGLVLVTGDVLRSYGLAHSDSVGLTYGGSAGFDWHMVDRHNSLGIFGGARLFPSLDSQSGESTWGIQAGAYLKHVF